MKHRFFSNFMVFLAVISVMTTASPALSVSIEAGRLYNEGVEAHATGKTSLAIELFEKAVKQDPSFKDAQYNLASLYYQQKDYEKANRAFHAVLKIDPADQQARYNLALTLEKQNKYRDAIQQLKSIPASDRKSLQASQKIEELQGLAAKESEAARLKAAKKPVTTKPKVTQPVSQLHTTTPVKPVSTTGAKKTVDTYATGFFGPTGLALSQDGTLYVANYSKNQIFRVLPSGQKSLFAEGNGLKGPLGLAMDSRNGNLYVANYLENTVSKVDSLGNVSTLASGFRRPYYLLLDAASRILYVSEQETNAVSRIYLDP